MNPFLPALRELARIYNRRLNRGRLWLAQRKLAKAETDLGLLGWQQADFEGEAQAHIDQLRNFEREQARMTNESAGLGRSMRDGQEQRAAARKQHEERRGVLETEWRRVAEPVEAAEQQLAARRRVVVDFSAQIAELERGLEGVRAAQTALLTAETMTPEMRAELSRVRERSVVIPNTQADLRREQVQAKNAIRALEETVALGQGRVAEAAEKLRVLDAEFAASDGALERQIAGWAREKEALDRRYESLEKSKTSPYRQLGRILADNTIAPMNQPTALDAVLHRRAAVEDLTGALARSRQASRNEDRAALTRSWLLVAAVGAALIGLWIVLR